MKKYTLLSLSISAIFLSGCSSTAGNKSISNESKQSINFKIIRGKTTKNEVLALYGKPTNETSMGSYEEQWLYSSYKSDMTALTYVPIVNLLSSGADTQSRTLTVSFKGEKVSDWTFISKTDSAPNGF